MSEEQAIIAATKALMQRNNSKTSTTVAKKLVKYQGKKLISAF